MNDTNVPLCDKCRKPLDEDFHSFIDIQEDYRLTASMNMCSSCIKGLDTLLNKIIGSMRKGGE